MKIEEVGLVGFGRFGRMAYDYLRRDKKLRVYNHNPEKIQDIPERATLEETLSAPLIVLCVPISGMERFCKKMAPFLQEGQVVLLETNLDDVSGVVLGYAQEKLFDLGALDVWYTAVQMKKNRPGTVLSALVPNHLERAAFELILPASSGIQTDSLQATPVAGYPTRGNETSVEHGKPAAALVTYL